MYAYVQRLGCKKENTATYVYIRARPRTPTPAYVRQGSCTWLGRNGETASSSCSWGGNGMHRVHREAMKCIVFMGRQRNASCSWGGNRMRRVHRVGLDGTGDGNEAWRTAERRKQTSYGRNGGSVDRERCGVPQNGGNRPPTVETGVLLIGRSVVYRKTEETDLLRSKRGSC